MLGITPARWGAWEVAETRCQLDDRTSCPRSRPTRTSARERLAIKRMVTSEALAHMPMRALALLAQRDGIVHVAVGTWYRLARKEFWRRPRTRVHPRPPRVGLRATYPGQFLHIDVTVLKLLDNTTAYVQAILDNYSRRILAYLVSSTKTAEQTALLVRQAATVLAPVRGEALSIIADDGSENSVANTHVAAALQETGSVLHIAQVDILASNSMIERFWASLKHTFLYRQKLDSLTALTRFVHFYVHQHNFVIPHSAFHGQTPDEVFHGRAADLPDRLAQLRAEARVLRVAENQGVACGACPPSAPPLRPVR